MKIIKHYRKVKEFYNEHVYNHHMDATINILLYFFYHTYINNLSLSPSVNLIFDVFQSKFQTLLALKYFSIIPCTLFIFNSTTMQLILYIYIYIYIYIYVCVCIYQEINWWMGQSIGCFQLGHPGAFILSGMTVLTKQRPEKPLQTL